MSAVLRLYTCTELLNYNIITVIQQKDPTLQMLVAHIQ